ncbi:membrane protein [Microbacterium barkeri]|uniref:Membrane protein n=1 Tax=Microbacterium barkeri TaxID=33917 RepID=A0A9W6H3V7_9MICO|nr:ABC transporter permease [Microbacterium barkeri]MDR6876490.1 ABC-type antimicrobial peptide transport system permease subunit [Microbacterium barkeri]GLJ62117.1 membrane protein [Microbacterium barkeri]
MFGTYLRRELAGRKRQTMIVASGLAVAIALVIIVNALSAGVRDAQNAALESVYGVGTDLTVSGAAAEPGEGRGQRFEFGEDDGETAEDGTTQVSQSRLAVEMGRSTLASSAVETAAGTEGVSAVSGALALTNITFDGELPSAPEDAGDATQAAPAEGEAPPGGGGGGFGGGAFDLDSISVLGVDDAATTVGPLSSVEVSDGRALEASDAGAAVVDATYASTNELAVGDAVELGGEEFEIVGIAASATDSADTAADVFIPLDIAQELSGAGDVVSTVYVQAASAGDIAAVQAALEEELPEATVSSQSDLASTVSGSLSSASSLISSLGTWLSVIVLAVAVLLALLFTLSGVSRRTREFGTLKAIGWTNARVVRQVAGESVVQGLIGGAAGVALGVIGAVIIDLVRPTISTSSAAAATGPGAGGGMGGPFGAMAETASDIALTAPLDAVVIIAAVALAVAGGLVAGAIGGWRAARLSPAEALRSVG